ncbi:MAG: isocitrate lyase/phosphoenolpyruvate mutase family protein, partial [Pseudomonadota bacterium]
MTREAFAALHTGDQPLILYNIWDAGSAKAVAKAGAKANATGSHSLAGAQGYADGEAIPFDTLLTCVRMIAQSSDLPLTVDIEAGFADDLETLAANARRLIEAGAIGCNFEDQLIGGEGLRAVDEQAKRIAVVDEAGLFVNARTDTFLDVLKQGGDANTAELVDAAIERGHAYKQAGAGSYFIPGLSEPGMIATVCQNVDLPINVMRLPGMVSNAELADLGVARISYGPGPWREAMAA